jgi:hypothetical protein
MFGMFSAKTARQFIDRGTVRCPARAADVEVDVCLTCQWLVEIDEEGSTPFVRCRPVSARSSLDSKRAR